MGEIKPGLIFPGLEEYSLKEKLGYFITDNANSNDTCVTEIVETLGPDLDANNQRLRGMGYIINLIAKEFLFLAIDQRLLRQMS